MWGPGDYKGTRYRCKKSNHSKVSFNKIKDIISEEIPGILSGVSPDIKNSIMEAVKHFESNYNTKPTPLFDEMRYAFDFWLSKFAETGSGAVKTYMANQSGSDSEWLELLKCVFRRSNHTLPLIFFALVTDVNKDNYYYSCLEKCDILQKKFDEIFQGDAVVLFPTHPEPPPHYLMTIPKFPNIRWGEIFNILRLPVTAIPAGLSNGLPVGIQRTVQRSSDDSDGQLAKAFGGWKSPCHVKV